MEPSFHRFSELFAQLGLRNDAESIRSFIEANATLAGEVKLDEAAIWSPAQAQLLRELIALDADWAEVADQLNAALHRK